MVWIRLSEDKILSYLGRWCQQLLVRSNDFSHIDVVVISCPVASERV
ncbi:MULTISPECIES: hypothetical protein [unclassified Okeania]|nr:MULTISPECIES: hypothetical protein [unclassified Okeania]NES74547.1 hypothetical protein [Okeania sp. SIO1H4]NET20848.1 hypothetical protein [Okeania sp. SIO1H5]NET74726.1 hypothetical protein [Okeania sp. SIO1F9]NET94083.1 hypothetical protein [Okeania sp. SIO1H2]